MKERYYSESLLRSLAYEDDVNGNCDGMIDFTVIDSISGADVTPVIHGEWILHKDGSGTCKNCNTHQKSIWDMDNWQNFCGHCGAKMDGGNKQ